MRLKWSKKDTEQTMPIDSFRITTKDQEWFVYTDGRNFDVTWCTREEFDAFEKNPENGIQARFAPVKVVEKLLNILLIYLELEPDPSVSDPFMARTRAIEKHMKNLPADFIPPPPDQENVPCIEWQRKPSPTKYNEGRL